MVETNNLPENKARIMAEREGNKDIPSEIRRNPEFRVSDFTELAQQRDKSAKLRAKNIEDALLKPKTPLKDKKATSVPKKEDRGENGAKNGAGNYMAPRDQVTYDTPPLKRIQDEPDWQKGVKEAGIEEQPPEGLTEIQKMVWKNDQKRKNQVKKPIQIQFGAGKVDKPTDPF